MIGEVWDGRIFRLKLSDHATTNWAFAYRLLAKEKNNLKKLNRMPAEFHAKESVGCKDKNLLYSKVS